ncbi:MAG: hypothetical protein FJ095_05640 [Deltaproteobacteria bacterium]|nr:hypothetical protein [Deltaproteobacteria bacterium]
MPFGKVHTRPELAGHTEDGEPMLRLAEGDRRAATMREVDRRAIDAALARARSRPPPAQEESGSEVRPSVAEIAPVAPPRRTHALVWVACLAIPGLVVAAVLVLSRGATDRARQASTSNGWRSFLGSPVAPSTASSALDAPTSSDSASSRREDEPPPAEPANLATASPTEPRAAAPQASGSPAAEPSTSQPRILIHVKSK